MSSLRIVFVGHVDHGKSTLIGRLLTDTKSIPEDKVKKIQNYCKSQGKPFEYAFLLDALQEEQEQGITIDTTQIHFKSPKRNYTIIDAPGHKEFLKNMISGAASAEAAILIIDANEGVQEQSRRHGYLLSLLGIKQVIVVVNKMDLVKNSEKIFNKIVQEYKDFLTLLKVYPKHFIPVSSKLGDNVAKVSKKMKWFKGQIVLKAIDTFKKGKNLSKKPLRFPVQDIYKFDDKRIIAGRAESGSLKTGDEISFSPGDKYSIVKSIETWSAPKKKEAKAGESVGITLKDDLFIERGQIIHHKHEKPLSGNVFKSNIFWMGKTPLKTQKKYLIRLTTSEEEAEILTINKVLDASSLKVLEDKTKVKGGDVAEVVIKTKNDIAFDAHSDFESTGRFVIVEEHDVCGGGIVMENAALKYRKIPKKKKDITFNLIAPTVSLITKEERLKRNKHPGKVIWLTGIPGSGRNTLAKGLERKLFDDGYNCYLLSGANLRYGLSSDLDYSQKSRHEQARRISEIAKLFLNAGIIVIISSVSPFIKDRVKAKNLIGEENFIEVQVVCSLATCKKRNPHGLLKTLENIPGFDAPYEKSKNPDIIVSTEKKSPEKSIHEAYDKLKTILFT